ncbi:MAG: hypothetical protein ABJG68_14540 [Crocinitomicaceae bacterium]
MSDFYLFEAGATKTAFVHVTKDGCCELLLPPFNPNRKYDAFEIAIHEGIDLLPNKKVIFYGAGLASDENKNIVHQLFSNKSLGGIKVYDDILGAARATLGTTPGIVAILGTGGLAAKYDGKKIVKRRGGYGYLIDDLGGGFELGKRFLALWLNGDLSIRVDGILKEKLKIEKSTFTKEFYKDPDIGFISNLVPFVLQFEDEPAITQMIKAYFKSFIETQVLPLTKEFEINEFSMVGSVAFLFYRHITLAAKDHDLRINQCVQNPIQRLIEFHS